MRYQMILVGGEKGGSGKSTIAMNLAAACARAGEDVCLVDTDAQATSSHWIALRAETDAPAIAGVQLRGQGVAAQLRDLAGRYERVVVDAGGRDSVELRAAMTVAARLLVPIQASQADTWTLEAMHALVEQAQGFNDTLSAALVINRASTNPRVREVDEARELAREYEQFRVIESVLCDRIAYRHAVREGMSVLETGDDPKAAREVEQLHREITQ